VAGTDEPRGADWRGWAARGAMFSGGNESLKYLVGVRNFDEERSRFDAGGEHRATSELSENYKQKVIARQGLSRTQKQVREIYAMLNREEKSPPQSLSFGRWKNKVPDPGVDVATA